MYKAIIFDFFGTLTEGNCAPEDKIVAEWKLDKKPNFNYEFIEDVVCGTSCNLPFTEERRLQYFQTLIDKLQLPNDSESRLIEIFRKDIEGEKLITGSAEIVSWLKNKQYKLGMISDLANPDYNLSFRWGFADFFDFRHLSYDAEWVNSNNYKRVLKPEPKIFERMVKKLESDYENTLMIGNSLNSDIEPARKLGIRAILVDYKKKYKEDKDRIENLEELRQIL